MNRPFVLQRVEIVLHGSVTDVEVELLRAFLPAMLGLGLTANPP